MVNLVRYNKFQIGHYWINSKGSYFSMKTISLNGKWKCKPNLKKLGIENKGDVPENYNLDWVDN